MEICAPVICIQQEKSRATALEQGTPILKKRTPLNLRVGKVKATQNIRGLLAKLAYKFSQLLPGQAWQGGRQLEILHKKVASGLLQTRKQAIRNPFDPRRRQMGRCRRLKKLLHIQSATLIALRLDKPPQIRVSILIVHAFHLVNAAFCEFMTALDVQLLDVGRLSNRGEIH